MKRCPQCDFLYEDDQRLCDMDGGELVNDPRELPAPVQYSAPETSGRARRRRVAPLLTVAAVLCAATLPAYYVFTQRAAPPGPDLPPLKVASEPLPAPPEPSPETPAPTPTPSPVPSPAAGPHDVKSVSREPKRAQAPPTPPARKREEKRPRTESASRKKESKIDSILKKTGRVLKKPFEF